MSRNAADDVTFEDGYVLVVSPSVPSVAFAQQTMQAVDALLIGHEASRVMFDSRDTEPPAPEVGKVWWQWLQRAEHFDKVAIVARSEMVRVSANMTALAKSAAVKAFKDPVEAVAWLRRKS